VTTKLLEAGTVMQISCRVDFSATGIPRSDMGDATNRDRPVSAAKIAKVLAWFVDLISAPRTGITVGDLSTLE
jgi:hypothetical protein